MARKKEIEFPYVVTSGQSRVTIYRSQISGKERFQLRWWEFGKAQRSTKTDLDVATFEAQSIADRLKAGELAAINLDPTEANAYRHALEACGGVPIDAFCREYAEVKRRLGNVPPLQVIDDWISRNRGKSKPVNECVDLFCAELRAKDLATDYVRRSCERLDKVKTKFGARMISDISEVEIRDYVDSAGGGDRSKKNVRDIIVTLWRWARKKSYLPRDLTTEAERVEAPIIKRQSRIKIFTVDEMKALLDKADDSLLPVVAICGFMGVRSDTYGEISRMTWESVKWDQGEHGILEIEGKTGEIRRPAMQENLRAWLEPFKGKRTGPIWTNGRIDHAFAKLSESSGVKWQTNGLRHSFGSYRVAVTKSVDETSLEMGNSPQMVRKHYLEHVEEAEGKKWFAIMPKKKC